MERDSHVTASFLEEFRRSQLKIAATMAAKYRVEFTLEPTATLDEIRAFVTSMLQPTIDAAAARKVFRWPSHPNRPRTTSPDISGFSSAHERAAARDP